MTETPDFLTYDLSKLKVLIVDDTRTRRDLVRYLLNALDIDRVFEADSATAAVQNLGEFNINMIVAELTMGPANGLDLVREIRASKHIPNPGIPIIMLSADPVLQKVCEARDAGIDEFVARPFTLKVLYDRMVATVQAPRPIVVKGPYMGPDRRRRTNRRKRSHDRRRKASWLFARR